jgi:hypothetical protein
MGMEILVNKLALILVAANIVSHSLAETTRLSYQQDSGLYSFPAKVNGKHLDVSINLAIMESYVKPAAIGYADLSVSKVSLEIETLGLSKRNFDFRTDYYGSVDMVLGRGFFKTLCLKWDTARQTLEIDAAPPLGSESCAIDFSKGVFALGAERVRLPFLSPFTAVPVKTMLLDGYHIEQLGTKLIEADGKRVAFATYAGTMQSLVASKIFETVTAQKPKLQEEMIPGASFLGSQIVTIDFPHSIISFARDSKLNGIFLLRQKTSLLLNLEGQELKVVGSTIGDFESLLKQNEFIGATLTRVGDRVIELEKLGSHDYILELLREFEQKKSVRVETRNKYFTINIE